jgi:hypothetical protein
MNHGQAKSNHSENWAVRLCRAQILRSWGCGLFYHMEDPFHSISLVLLSAMSLSAACHNIV